MDFENLGLSLYMLWFFYNNWKNFFTWRRFCSCCPGWNRCINFILKLIKSWLVDWNQKSCDGCRQSQFTCDGECTTRMMTKENTDSEFLRKKNRKKKQKKNHKVSCKPSATIAENAPIGTAKKTEAAVLEEASRASWEQVQEWHNKSCSYKKIKCKRIQLKTVTVFNKPC